MRNHTEDRPIMSLVRYPEKKIQQRKNVSAIKLG